MLSPNSAYIDALYAEFLIDPNSVSEQWRAYFTTQYSPNGSSNGASIAQQTPAPHSIQNGTQNIPAATVTTIPEVKTTPIAIPQPMQESKHTTIPLGANDKTEILSGIAARIAENMNNSLHVPTATSFRAIPVKVLEENRRLLNKFLATRRKSKVSFTHILAWALVKSLVKYPKLNDAFSYVEGKPARINRGGINIGLAVDTTRKDGTRMLVVPSIKDAGKLTFAEFCAAYDDLIARSRKNALTVDELSGATISLTNPGTIGTLASVPRLMEGQGLIIATGGIEYPAEFQAVMPEVLSTLAISKVLNITSTYDHRIIQGAESGEFLAHLSQLILGQHNFYDQIFAQLQIPFEPMRWSGDKRLNPFGSQDELEVLDKEALVAKMIHSYRVRGHLQANINPLGLQTYYYPDLDPSSYGFTIWDLDRQFDTGGLGGVNRATLRDIIESLRDTYCRQIGIEFMHINDPDQREWIQDRIETTHFEVKFDREEKKHNYLSLLEAEAFEQYLHTKFIGHKRFSLEGSETTLSFMEKVLEQAAEKDLKAVVIGMAHRGRLNVLAHLLNKPYEKIFDEFEGKFDPDSYQGSGDVKYHMGARGDYKSRFGKSIEVLLAPNPSHLEAVNPVVEGMARAIDDIHNDKSLSTALPILVHGDAAFIGQGVVAETLNMARLTGYKTGGTIHVVINNQIGFTTSPDDARSTTYATGIAKILQVPILHVNGDDPEAVRACAMFAFEYREKFNDDVIVDVYGYRKYGHNEGDEPTFTQPLLYKKIRQHTAVRQVYRKQLMEEKAFSDIELTAFEDDFKNTLNEAFNDRVVENWQDNSKRYNDDTKLFEPVDTRILSDIAKQITSAITHVPAEFHINPKLADLLKKRAQMIENDEPLIDYGMGEALAFGSLLLKGHPLRLTGQDVSRGTFSHRHAVLFDFQTEEAYIPLNNISEHQSKLRIHNSPLSEAGVMGFEYGYSTLMLDGLTLWEAQFGDFANGAQIIIDQFIASAEEKWGQLSNLTLLLPHGYEGQGPEHSSARLERFLQLCAEDNMIVANFTTPAQYFHAIRRQILASYRKPLIVMTPKANLRRPISRISDFTDKMFEEIIDDLTITNKESVRRVIFCSGKVYYDILAERERINANDVAIVRVEQLYPFHTEKAKSILAQYARASHVLWVQEEPKNQGAWSFIAPYLQELLLVNQQLKYVGRNAGAAPATGLAKVHEHQLNEIKHAAFAAM